MIFGSSLVIHQCDFCSAQVVRVRSRTESLCGRTAGEDQDVSLRHSNDAEAALPASRGRWETTWRPTWLRARTHSEAAGLRDLGEAERTRGICVVSSKTHVSRNLDFFEADLGIDVVYLWIGTIMRVIIELLGWFTVRNKFNEKVLSSLLSL